MKHHYLSFLMAVCTALTAMANDTFVFVDAQGNVLGDGATLVINKATEFSDPETGESGLLYDSGVKVRNTTSQQAALLVSYNVSTLDNGVFQLCFPMECTAKDQPGMYRTSAGLFSANETRALAAEWISSGTGKCSVTLQLDVQKASSSFPPTFTHLAYGPQLTLVFGDTLEGDVDGNSLVNGSDVTALYNKLLNGTEPAGNADVDGNSVVNGSDVTALYNILLK